MPSLKDIEREKELIFQENMKLKESQKTCGNEHAEYQFQRHMPKVYRVVFQ